MITSITDSKSLFESKETVNALSNQKLDFFSNLEWYKNFIDTVIAKDKDACFFIHSNIDDEKDDTVLPIKVTTSAGQKQIQSLTNYYSPIYTINFSEFTSFKFSNLFKGIQSLNWSVAEFRPMSLEDTFTLRQSVKYPSIPFFCFGNWYLPVEGKTFEEYFSNLSSQVRNTVNRKAKKFKNIHDTHIEILTSPSQVEQAIHAFNTVYQSSWKIPEPYPDFIPGLITAAAEQNCLRLGIAYLGEKPIAAQLWIVADNTAYIFKLAYDEAYKQYSAGTVLTSHLMKYVIDVDKVDIVDYLCGDDHYKKDWMSHRRERWGLLIFNTRNFRGVLELCREMPKYWLKTLFTLLKI